MIKPIIIAVKAAKTARGNVFYETNSFMIIGMNKISDFSTAVFTFNTHHKADCQSLKAIPLQ
jgi:hypothetical protein